MSRMPVGPPRCQPLVGAYVAIRFRNLIDRNASFFKRVAERGLASGLNNVIRSVFLELSDNYR